MHGSYRKMPQSTFPKSEARFMDHQIDLFPVGSPTGDPAAEFYVHRTAAIAMRHPLDQQAARFGAGVDPHSDAGDPRCGEAPKFGIPHCDIFSGGA
jgi:hypothetical protein